MRSLLGAPRLPIAVVGATLLLSAPTAGAAQAPNAEPLDVARAFATRYPTATQLGYIPALSWSGALRLTEITGEARWAEEAATDMMPFLAGTPPATGRQLTTFGGFAAFADLAAFPPASARSGFAAALAARAAGMLRYPFDTGADTVPYATEWTDDMYMVTSVLARYTSLVAPPAERERTAAVIGRVLIEYSARLQRPDGLFVHAPTGPFAWGRGNGFAALGLVEALTLLPEAWSDRARVLEIYRRQMQALLSHQSDDGSWRQVVDEVGSYRELTVTVMTVTAMARGVRLGWLDRATYLPAIERGWAAVLARVSLDGSVRDACTSTGAGTTLAYYLERAVVNGTDDRAGGLVLLGAIEMEELRRAPARGR